MAAQPFHKGLYLFPYHFALFFPRGIPPACQALGEAVGSGARAGPTVRAHRSLRERQSEGTPQSEPSQYTAVRLICNPPEGRLARLGGAEGCRHMVWGDALQRV